MFRLFFLTAAALFIFPLGFVAAQDSEYADVETVAPEAGGDALDAEAYSDYAADAALDNEDASWAAGVAFDGSEAGGTVQDPSTLEPQPFSATPNEE